MRKLQEEEQARLEQAADAAVIASQGMNANTQKKLLKEANEREYAATKAQKEFEIKNLELKAEIRRLKLEMGGTSTDREAELLKEIEVILFFFFVFFNLKLNKQKKMKKTQRKFNLAKKKHKQKI